MLICNYIFYEDKAPQDFEIWHFPINIFAKKVVFLVSRGENFVTFGPLCKNIFGQSLDISVGAGKFWVCEGFFPEDPKLVRNVLCDFCQQIFSRKEPFWCDLQKKDSCRFLQTLAPFFEVKQRWAPFFPGFSWILTRFSGMLSGFQQIKTFGGVLAPPPPTPLPLENPL